MAQFTYYGSWENVDVRYSVSQNQAANTTTITADAYHRRPGAGGGSYNYSGVNFALTIAGNTKSRSWTWDSLPSGGERLILSHSVTIPHNSDGSHAPVQISVYCATGTSSLGTVSASQSVALATIPRAATMSVDKTTVTIGDYGPVVTIDRKNASFKHKLFLNLNGTDKRYYYPYDIPSGLGTTTIQFNPPMWLCEWTPDAEAMICTLGVYTYQADGTTPVGATGVNIRLEVPASVRPTIKSHEAKPVEKDVDGEYWQNHTLAAICFEWGLWRSDQLFGAQVSTVQVFADAYSVTYTRARNPDLFKADGKGIDSNFTTRQAGLRGYKIVLTDTRGRTAVAEGTYPVLSYHTPIIRSFTTERCDAAGNPNASGSYVKATFDVEIKDLPKNAGTLTIKRGNSVDLTLSLGGASPYKYQTSRQIVNVTPDSAHEFILEVRDHAGNVATYTSYVGKGYVIMDFCPDGAGIGETAERETVSLRSGDYRIAVTKRGIEAQRYQAGALVKKADLLALAGFRAFKITKTIQGGYINLTNADLGIGQDESKNYVWGIQPVYVPDAGIMYTTIQIKPHGMYVYIRSELPSQRPPDGLNITLNIMRF
uniref:DUF859 family phage minor structural protein n=1 Tax=Ndongobacter massiliensis TaxID=1871025 RepID=UPI0009319E83|nr:DUF859 family phage minor structural protein [Ndongobacter massiliensis]